ncbi:MAG TPA: glycosyltransferase family 1 protein [Candidatus Binataceae bacterium]|nr:glycosyltransferase family 1 protein [Candidatus Binataceae bacterium]
MTTRLRVAILCDFTEEGWPSMDLVGDMLTQSLQRYYRPVLDAIRIRPNFVRRFSRFGGTQKAIWNLDRFLNRMFDYPRYLRRMIDEFDVFHLVDHSYSHLLHEIPAKRPAIVTCHDLDTFSCLLDPESRCRSWGFRMMTRRILAGFHRALRFACVSRSTRQQLIKHLLIPPENTSVVPNGIAGVYSPHPDLYGDSEALRLLGPPNRAIELLSVGGTAHRKRLDVLLHVFATVRRRYSDVRLIRVGGPLTTMQRDLADQLGLSNAIIELPFLSRRTLAAVYRRAAVLIFPSEAEGFGLPVLESMACGTPVVASDIAALRETGGAAAKYAPVGDIQQWSEAVIDVLHTRYDSGLLIKHRERGLDRARQFSWRNAAKLTVETYSDLLRCSPMSD